MFKQQLAAYYQKNKPRYCPADLVGKKREVKIAAELAHILNGRTEYPAGYGLGRIDIITNKLLIEVKYSGSTNEKNALGQLLVYKYSLDWRHKLGLAIIGNPVQPGIHKFCLDHDIVIFEYNDKSDCRWRVK